MPKGLFQKKKKYLFISVVIYLAFPFEFTMNRYDTHVLFPETLDNVNVWNDRLSVILYLM